MSMNTYGLHEVALYVDTVLAAFLTRAENLASGQASEFDNDPDFFEKVMTGEMPEPEDYLLSPTDIANLFEDGTYFSEFDGKVATLNECMELGVENPIEETMDGDGIAIIYLDEEPSLLKQAYSSVDEIVDELREKLADYIKDIPEEYDLRRNICKIGGTYFC